jgi:hypothetical protein
MLRKASAVKRGGRIKEVRIPDNSAAEVAIELWQSKTGPSTIAARNEFVLRVRELLERHLGPIEVEVFLMKVFVRLEYPEIVSEFVRRSEESARAADYQRILAKLDSRTNDAAPMAQLTTRMSTSGARTPSASDSTVLLES